MPPDTPGSSSYFIRHWRGELSLAKAFWLNVVVTAVVFGTLMWRWGEVPETYISASTAAWALASAAILATVTPIALWGIVGAWRSADRYAAAGGPYGRSVAAQLTLCVIGLAAFSVGGASVPLTVELMRIAIGEDDGEIANVRVMRDGTELEINGQIEFGLYPRVEAVLAQNPGVKVVHLSSPGGRSVEGRLLGGLIAARNLTTFVRTRCASACVTVYLGGARRLADAKATFGFHRSGIEGLPDGLVEIDEDSKDRKIYLDAGVAPSFVERVHATPFSASWEPPLDEVIEAGVVHEIVPSDTFAISGFGKLSDADANEALLKTPLYVKLKERDPQGYAEVLAAFKTAFGEGRSIADMRKVVHPIIIRAMFAALPFANDETLLNFLSLLHTQALELGQKDARYCVALWRGNSEDYVAHLSGAAREQEIAVITAILVSESVARPSLTEAERDVANGTVAAAAEKLDETRRRAVGDLDAPDVDPVAACDGVNAIYGEILGNDRARAVIVARMIFGDLKPGDN